MNIKELRDAMASDATKEKAALEKEICELKKNYEKQQEENNIFTLGILSDCDALANRCFTMTHGAMCGFCELSEYKCKHALTFKQKIKFYREIKKETENEQL